MPVDELRLYLPARNRKDAIAQHTHLDIRQPIDHAQDFLYSQIRTDVYWYNSAH